MAAADPPRWAAVSSLGLAATGLAVSAYLTYEHFTASKTLACSDSGVVNCLKVTTSAQSKVFGVPVAVLGLLYFVAMVPLCLPRAWAMPAMERPRLAATAAGVAFVLYLLYAELFVIGSICLWCTAVHAVALALFGVVLFAGALREPA